VVALSGERLVDQLFHTYRDVANQAGRNLALGQDMALGIGFCIAPTQEEAIEKVRPYHDERYKWFAPFGFVRYTDSQGRPWGTPGAPARRPRIEDGVEQKAWFCGPPDQFISFLRDLEAKYPGLEDIILHWPEGMPWRVFRGQLTAFAREVMPSFTGRQTAAVAGSNSDGG
jgi:alkanesulfonate monooxygenase SsuD/methylene tetrahydromethanopterin reductase-like flavin-dependent oxidoreductase (luciferase family)